MTAAADPSTGGCVVRVVPMGDGTGGWVVTSCSDAWPVTSVGETRTPLIEQGIVRQMGGKVWGVGFGFGAEGGPQSFPALPQGVGIGVGISGSSQSGFSGQSFPALPHGVGAGDGMCVWSQLPQFQYISSSWWWPFPDL